MTKREKIIRFLNENGIDIFRFPFIEEKQKYQRPGTIVIRYNYLTREEQLKLRQIDMIRCEDHCIRNPRCPIEVHIIRDHFEWKWDLIRIIWKGERT